MPSRMNSTPGMKNYYFVIPSIPNSSIISSTYFIYVVFYGRISDGVADNFQARIDATVSVFGNFPALLDELSRAEAETAATIEHLPESFTVRKNSYWRVGFQLLKTSITPLNMPIRSVKVSKRPASSKVKSVIILALHYLNVGLAKSKV